MLRGTDFVSFGCFSLILETETTCYLPLFLRRLPGLLLCLVTDVDAAYELLLRRPESWGFDFPT